MEDAPQLHAGLEEQRFAGAQRGAVKSGRLGFGHELVTLSGTAAGTVNGPIR